ncbi:MAG: zinc carboxypeptidase, partial [Flavisolibacter sp.]
VIDPCLNPDGRDRYVNWFNSIVGKVPNPSIIAREHEEPWPGGRTNHYNFDLNRDWAWQTQVESQARVALYDSWLPQVHVDFHEQGINAPYYFAPAAQPYHEVITKWQRDFQNTIGRNNARYFDEKGWLFFTKEEFDLTYPAYGDTYPLYNGAIGMTYEQGGHSRGGLAVETASGDTLTLVDRAMHHYTTSLSTIEVSSQNAPKLLSEFKKFYDDAVSTGVGSYKSYVIKYSTDDAEKIRSLLKLLDKNKIRYGTAKATGNLKGFRYETRKEEPFSVSTNDIIIPSLQPKSALVKVLFEPSTVLVDTLAYDITAWSLPYAFELNAYASNQKLDVTDSVSRTPINNTGQDAYAYVVNWNGMQSVKLLAELLQKGIKLRYNERPFEINGQSFERGAILILKTSNQHVENLWKTVTDAANSFNLQVTPVTSGFVDRGYDFGSSKVHPMKARKVAMLTGEEVSSSAAGEVWYYFDQIINYPVTLVNARDASTMNWSDFDVVILPDGNYRFLNDKNATEQFKNWINHGGHVVAMESAVSKLAQLDWGLRSKKEESADTNDVYAPLKKFEERDRDFIPSSIPGAIFRVELDNTNPLAFGYPDHYYTLKLDDNVYEFIKEGGWNVGVLKRNKAVAGFVGSKVKGKLQDGLLFGVQEMGNGTITYLADDVLFRSFWENGKLMFANAVFLVGQ